MNRMQVSDLKKETLSNDRQDQIQNMGKRNRIQSGVWPVMLTPYTTDNKIDYDGVQALIDWYIDRGVAGIFAVCQSSEMFYLTDGECRELAEFVIGYVGGRVGVVISGHTKSGLEEQMDQLQKMAALKPDALVLVSNRLAKEDESGGAFLEHLDRLMKELPPEMPLGMYECPYPYKRLLTDRELLFMAESGRFAFLKDVCCDLAMLRRRVGLVEGSGLKLFNANSATLYDSLQFGTKGFCGVMANFHPDLYVWLCKNYRSCKAEEIAQCLSVCSLIEPRCYPMIAKRYLNRYEELAITEFCRAAVPPCLPSFDSELEAVHRVTELLQEKIRFI